MENGLYHVILTVDEDVTNYVAVIRDGLIDGGDSISCFTGTIRFEGEGFHADLLIRKYAELDRYLPVFGSEPARVSVRGTATAPDTATGTASCERFPHIAAQVELRRLRFAGADDTLDKAAA
jgi:hypothetical protein